MKGGSLEDHISKFILGCNCITEGDHVLVRRFPSFRLVHLEEEKLQTP